MDGIGSSSSQIAQVPVEGFFNKIERVVASRRRLKQRYAPSTVELAPFVRHGLLVSRSPLSFESVVQGAAFRYRKGYMGNSCRCQRPVWLKMSTLVVSNVLRYKSSRCCLATLLRPRNPIWCRRSQKEMKGKWNGLMSDSDGAIRDDYFFQTREIQLCLPNSPSYYVVSLYVDLIFFKRTEKNI